MKTITYNPETHRLVPVEPTEEMIEAWDMAPICEFIEDEFLGAYRAMLSAAPQPGPVEVEPVAIATYVEYRTNDGDVCKRVEIKRLKYIPEHSLLYTAPPDYEEIKRQRDELAKALEWQPIETAPKDGQAFDVWVMSTKNKSYGVRMTNVYYNNGVICGMRYPDTSFGEYASHWMPLPAAPALASVKGGE